MSNSNSSSLIPFKQIVGTLGLFAVFGFLASVLSGFAGRESIEEREYKGAFSPEVTEARWANREEIDAAQAKLFDADKVSKALAAIAKSPAAPSESAIVVPGSPTFLKQMKEQSATDTEKEAAPEPAKPKDAPPAKEEKK